VGLIKDLGRGPVALDTVGFIYFLEEHVLYLPVIEPLFRAVDAGRLELFTSSLTLLEVLVVPYRSGDLNLARRYEELLTRSRRVHLREMDREELRSAAVLRARFGLRTPDALQVAAALSGGCKAFVTNDRAIPRIPGLRVLQLNDYVKP
jgi:predicted nucleic acid-binding protein